MRRGPGKFGDRYQRPVKTRHKASVADNSSSSTGLKKDGSGPYFLPRPTPASAPVHFSTG